MNGLPNLEIQAPHHCQPPISRQDYFLSLCFCIIPIFIFELNIEFIVSPYEADSQMAYMVKVGIADFAISEDSDLIAYGCPKMLMKLDNFGEGMQWSYDDFKAKEIDIEKDKSLKPLKYLQALSKEDFSYACVMAGCEYITNIERIGLKVALKHFNKLGSFAEVMKFLRTNTITKDRVPEMYEE